MISILVSLLLGSAAANATTVLKCDYDFYSGPFATIELEIGEEGALPSAAKITQYGRVHYESVTPVEVEAGERYHYWLSKENPQNALEVIIYLETKDGKNSKMINHHMPYGKVMTGICR